MNVGGNDAAATRDFAANQLGLEMLGGGTGCIGTPAQLTASLRQFETNSVDQTIFIQQGGNNQHEHRNGMPSPRRRRSTKKAPRAR